MSYTQLTWKQQSQIKALLKIGHKGEEIAQVLGSYKSTISRKLRCNHGLRGYRPKQDHFLAISWRFHKPVRIQPEIWKMIEDNLRLDWNPEQISGRLS